MFEGKLLSLNFRFGSKAEDSNLGAVRQLWATSGHASASLAPIQLGQNARF
jgi:hypothetical protein